LINLVLKAFGNACGFGDFTKVHFKFIVKI